MGHRPAVEGPSLTWARGQRPQARQALQLTHACAGYAALNRSIACYSSHPSGAGAAVSGAASAAFLTRSTSTVNLMASAAAFVRK